MGGAASAIKPRTSRTASSMPDLVLVYEPNQDEAYHNQENAINEFGVTCKLPLSAIKSSGRAG
jgi:hypothetical protein